MTNVTDTEIKQKGVQALIQALGEVNAERFISLLGREPFDYTFWQKEIFPKMDIYEISRRAMELKERKK